VPPFPRIAYTDLAGVLARSGESALAAEARREGDELKAAGPPRPPMACGGRFHDPP